MLMQVLLFKVSDTNVTNTIILLKKKLQSVEAYLEYFSKPNYSRNKSDILSISFVFLNKNKSQNGFKNGRIHLDSFESWVALKKAI